MIVTAGPNDEASPTIHVGAVSSPIAKTMSPMTSRAPARTSVATIRPRSTTRAGPATGDGGPGRRATDQHATRPDDEQGRVDDPGDE